MSAATTGTGRTVGLFGATGVGIGAIVGGGILVLAGVAFETTGPAAVVAFALNGVVAVLTALSFAELASSFPESGGAYVFAKKVHSVRAAFGVGWILWFAYLVAATLYALGFAYYGALLLRGLWEAFGGVAPAWLEGRSMILFLGGASTVAYALLLMRKSAGGTQWATVGKVVVFAIVLAFGLVAFVRQPVAASVERLSPFFPGGATGLIATMGYTFIALQGFEIIAAIAGQVKKPERTIPRAMFLSLGGALAIYLPLLLVVATVGVPAGGSITELARGDPETVMASAVQQFMGGPGYWLIVVAAVLSTLSALSANLLAAAHVASSMARDRTLPAVLARLHPRRRTPVFALGSSALIVVILLLMVPDLAAAGAAASLIFLVAFTLGHWTTLLARWRGGGGREGFRVPLFPALPIAGAVACAALALFQAVAVPTAGVIALIWLALGVLFYFSLFASRAAIHDASSEALDPALVRLRGRSPLVLLPIANPEHAAAMVAVANAVAPPAVGRVLLLSIVPSDDGDPAALRGLDAAQAVVRQALTASIGSGHRPEVLMTLAATPWNEIARVAREHRCESLLLGLGEMSQAVSEARLEQVANDVDCDVGFMRAPRGWKLNEATRILVPVGGRGEQHEMRARFLGSICRSLPRAITFLRVISENASQRELEAAESEVLQQADDTLPGDHRIEIAMSDDPAGAIVEEAREYDAVVLGLRRTHRQARFGAFALQVAREAPCATVLLSARR